MKATIAGLVAVLALAVFAPASQAQHHYQSQYPPRPFYPWCYAPIPKAPDMCGQGSWCAGGCGQGYGPNLNVYPPFPPFNGMLPPPCNGNGSPQFATHPFARGPRDFFMVDSAAKSGCSW